ncbi:MAG: DUF1631 family protein, partial [Formivibrio sp.]|nr:DUF1631 family protein [Formivibrio sp.]
SRNVMADGMSIGSSYVEQYAPEPKKGWLTEAQAVGTVLRNFFSSNSLHSEDHYPSTLNSQGSDSFAIDNTASTLVNSIHLFQQSSIPDAAGMLTEEGGIRNLILERRDELSEMSRDADEQMIIDIVAMLFEFILRDTEVPAEVRAQLGRLQFLVLKVALHDPALFTQENHPARMLVNRIGSIVQALQEQDPDGERVTTEICRIVEELLSDLTGDVSLFSQMLDEFDEFAARELRKADSQIDRAVSVVEKVENRTLEFARTTAMIANALSTLKVDDYLHDFLVNTWARVIERSSRTDPDQAKSFRLLVPDLIWSIAPKPDENDRKELFGLIPVLLNMLREGLTLLGWTAPERQVFIDWLVDSHRHALRATTVSAQLPPRSFVDAHFRQFVDACPTELLYPNTAEIQPVLDGKLLEEAINEMEIQLNSLDHLLVLDMEEHDENSMKTLSGESKEICLEDIFDRMRRGVPIEMTLDREPTRARLNWISPAATNLVLSIENQLIPSVISVKAFRRLFAVNRIRFLEDAPLFERAVHALLASADHLDHQAESLAA